MSIASELGDVLEEAELDFADTVTISGTAYACVASATTSGRRLDLGGFETEDDLTVTMRVETLAAPESQTQLTHSSGTYTIDRVTKLPGGTAYRLHCVSSNRGT